MEILKKKFKREQAIELDENGNPIEKEKKPLSKKAKIAIAAAAAAVAGGTGFAIYTLIFKKAPEPEMVKEVAEVTQEVAEEALGVAEEVVEVMA